MGTRTKPEEKGTGSVAYKRKEETERKPAIEQPIPTKERKIGYHIE